MGVRGATCVVVGVEKRATAKLQDPRTLRKLVKLDDHIALAFAGLNADARIAIDQVRGCCWRCTGVLVACHLRGVALGTCHGRSACGARVLTLLSAPASCLHCDCHPQLRVQCLSHRLTIDDAPTVKSVARHAGKMQQKCVCALGCSE